MPITPTVGRKVWFYADNSQAEPWDATVIKVVHKQAEDGSFAPDDENTPVNLNVINPDTGVQSLVTGVSVGDETTTTSHYRWMPYQQTQAAKAAEPPAPAPAPKPL